MLKATENRMNLLGLEAPVELEAMLGSHARPLHAAKKVTQRPTQIWRACDAFGFSSGK